MHRCFKKLLFFEDYCVVCLFNKYYLISYDAEIKLDSKGPIPSTEKSIGNKKFLFGKFLSFSEINCSNYALKDPCREMIRRKDPKVQRAIETAFYLRNQRKARSKAKSGLINFLKEVVERIKKVIRFFIKRANSMEMSC